MRWRFFGPDNKVLRARHMRLTRARLSARAARAHRPRLPDGVGHGGVRHGPPTCTSAPAERRSAEPLRARCTPGGGSCTSRGLAGARYHGLSRPRRGRLLCPWPSNPRVLEVRGGKAVALLDTVGRPAGPLIEPWAPNTVEGLFDFIEQAGRRADVVTVRYDRCLDYPVEIRGDQRVGLPDDWFWTKAGNLTPLVRARPR